MMKLLLVVWLFENIDNDIDKKKQFYLITHDNISKPFLNPDWSLFALTQL